MRSIISIVALFFFSNMAFAKTIDERWQLGIGDPTIFGWLTVVCYVVAAYLSFRQYRQLKPTGHLSKFWLYLAVALVLLSINKQLDLQTLFTQTLRDHAFANGWYEQRRLLQSSFVVVLVVAMLATLVTLRVFWAQSWHAFRMAWVGVILLCAFVLMRAASFHNFDALIGTEFLGLRANVILEVGALFVIIFAALRAYTLPREATQAVANHQEIETEADAVRCPSCAYPAVSEPVHGRLFKCKKCKHKYTLFITASRKGES